MKAEDKLEELGIALPEITKPLASYAPFVRTGNLIFISGTLPMVGGKPMATGAVGRNVDPEEARECARTCAINMLAVLKSAIGDLDRTVRIVKLTGYVASDPGFSQQPKVVDGASVLLGEVFGEKGVHSRAAVGVASLPLDCPVELEMIVEVDTGSG
jgi:enamine deaminase RidA (YjgF/YER057c/UK114 family)